MATTGSFGKDSLPSPFKRHIVVAITTMSAALCASNYLRNDKKAIFTIKMGLQPSSNMREKLLYL